MPRISILLERGSCQSKQTLSKTPCQMKRQLGPVLVAARLSQRRLDPCQGGGHVLYLCTSDTTSSVYKQRRPLHQLPSSSSFTSPSPSRQRFQRTAPARARSISTRPATARTRTDVISNIAEQHHQHRLLTTTTVTTNNTRHIMTSSSAEPPSSKRQRTHPQYELIYHPGIPGRGEFVRLVFEAAGVSYTDVANEKEDGYASNQRIWNGSENSVDGNPVAFAPPILRVPGALGGEGDGGDGGGVPRPLVISQTANILAYLGPKLGLSPGPIEDEAAHFHISGLAMTALDLNDAAHDTHHPLDNTLVYEDQKETALHKARVFRNERLPKFFGFFERVLEGNKAKGEGKHLVGNALTYADTTLWHVLDGLKFAFPKEMAARESEFPKLLGVFYDGVRQEKGIKDYLASGRRLDYSMGIFRHYPELDRQ